MNLILRFCKSYASHTKEIRHKFGFSRINDELRTSARRGANQTVTANKHADQDPFVSNATMSTDRKIKEGSYLAKAYDLKSVDAARDLYDEWADTYGKDMDDASYIAPALAAAALAAALAAHLQPEGSEGLLAKARILDAGCGTGYCGVSLSKLGARLIDGADLSPGMLEHARKTGVYGELKTADLSRPIAEVPSGSYDAVICVGTLTHGHVGPAALSEFNRLVKSPGVRRNCSKVINSKKCTCMELLPNGMRYVLNKIRPLYESEHRKVLN